MFVRNVQWVRRRHWYIVYDITVHRVQIIPGMLRTITSLKYYFGVFALRNLGATLTHPISTTTRWKIVIRGALKRSFLCHWKNIKKRYERTNIDRATAVRTFWRSSLLISTYLLASPSRLVQVGPGSSASMVWSARIASKKVQNAITLSILVVR